MDDQTRLVTKRETPDTTLRTSPKERSVPPPTVSIVQTIFYVLRQILELPITIILLVFGFILPELRDWSSSVGMGKKFDPAQDIGSLEGKVVLVTGGPQLPSFSIPKLPPY